jgi:hypothetical protein
MDPMTKMASALSDGAEELEETLESMTVDQLDEFIKNGGEGSFIGQLALAQTQEWEEKTAMAVKMGMEMAKEAFSVTEKGHKFDVSEAKMKERQGAEEFAHAEKHKGFGKDSKFLDRMRFGLSNTALENEPRHQAYVARKHSEGKNAYNPFGGALTPSKYEKGADPKHRGQYGSFLKGKGKEKTSAVFPMTSHYEVTLDENGKATGLSDVVQQLAHLPTGLKTVRVSADEELEKTSAVKEKTAIGMPAMGNIAAKVAPIAGKALHGLVGSRAGAVGGGAALGAGLGAARGLIKNPGTDPATGQQRSRLWAGAKGAVVGGGLGAGAGYGASQLARTAATSSGAIGKATRGAMGSVAGDVAGGAQRMKTLNFATRARAAAAPAAAAAPKVVQASIDFSKLAADFRKRTW